MSARVSASERRTVLVVDGEEQELDSLDATLTARGYDVVRARDGQEALEAFRCWRPDLILTEIPLPHMDGYQLCRELKSDPAGRDVPVIFYSAAYAHPADQAIAREMGAERFLVKPSEPELLAQAVAEALDQRKDAVDAREADDVVGLPRAPQPTAGRPAGGAVEAI